MHKNLLKPFFVKKIYYAKSSLMLALLLPMHESVSAADMPMMNFQQVAQETISGVVTGSSGLINGATVSIKGNTGATSTDATGRFVITAAKGQTLVISMVGHQTQEVLINSSTLSITLQELSEELEEIVIVGYGIQQKKESLTGALQTVSGKTLRDITTPAVENMLNGKAAGVSVAPGSGRPGSRGGVVIRGQATLNGTSSPLWVIDGVIVGSNPGDINPDDIENLTVLKDAASTSLYGSQGANGVVVVTTKRPSSSQMSVNLSSKIGFNQLNNGNLDMMNGQELYDFYASFANQNEIKFTRWNEDLRDADFDWWNLATKTGFVQNHNVSIQGGTEKLQSYMSVGYYNELGAVKGYNYDRYNVRLNTVFKPYDWLTIKPTLVGARRGTEDRQYSTTSMYSNLPWDSPFDANGELVPHRYSGWVNAQNTNYLYDLQWNHNGDRNFELNGNLDFDIKLTDWLTFSSVNNYRYNNYGSQGYVDPRSNGGLNVQGRISEYRSEYARRYTNQILRFNKKFDKHAVNGILAYEFNDYSARVLDAYGTGFIPGFEVLDVASIPERTKGSINEWATQSYLTNVNYSYDDRYLGQVSLRRDEASNFGKKSGMFYSISGGWNLHRENWFDVSWVNNLKVRASYGTVGNRPTSPYPQYALYAISTAAGYNGTPGLLINQISNEGLTWEETATKGLGVDGAFLDNRLRVNFDIYDKNTKNILFSVPVSGLTGVKNVWKNIGKMNNRGVELSLGGDIIRNENWNWSVDVNMGINKNKLTDIYRTRQQDGSYIAKPVIIGDGLGIAGSASRVLEIGLPVDTYYLPEWAGVNTDTGAPMWYKVTRDEQGNEIERTTTSNYAQATQEKMGKAAPDLFGGFNTTLSYKEFDLGAVFGYAIGGQIYNYSRQEYDSDGTYTDRNQMNLQDGWSRWEKPGDVATHPIAKYNNQDKGNSFSSRYLEDGSFLRLRSLTLGYNLKLPQSNIKNIRLFFTGENMFTWTNYSGVDPEISFNEGSGSIISSAGPGVYPAVRKYMFGVNVSF